MRFSLGTTGADSVNSGIGSIFKALAAAPQLRQQAQMDAELRKAQTYAHNMSGNKHAAEADGLNYTLAQRKGVEDRIASDPSMADYAKSMYRIFGLTGDTNADRVAKAGSEFQQQQAIADIQAGADPTRTGQAYAAVSGKMPFTNIGNTGRNLNQLTGIGAIAEEALAGGYDRKTQSEIAENNAQAAYASAGAAERKAKTERAAAGLGKPLTAAQLRENVAIAEARERIAGMPQDQIDELLAKDSFSLTAGDKNLLAVIKAAHKPMFGEDEFVRVQPQPTPPAPPQRGLLARMFDAVVEREPTPAKSAEPAASTPTMGSGSDALSQARAAIARGAPRAAVIQRLRERGIDPAGL